MLNDAVLKENELAERLIEESKYKKECDDADTNLLNASEHSFFEDSTKKI